MTKFVHHARKVARDATAGPMDLQMAIDHHVMVVLHATVIVHHVMANVHRVTANAHRVMANAHRVMAVLHATEIVHHVTANAHRVTVSDLPDLQRRSVLSKTLCDLMPTKTESSTKQS
jgi:hypothetical protein